MDNTTKKPPVMAVHRYLKMKKKTGIIIGAVAGVLVIGGIVGGNSGKKNNTSSTPTSSASDTFSSAQTTSTAADVQFDSTALLAADNFDAIVDAMNGTAYDTDFAAVIGQKITFTGTPNATDSDASTIVFSSRAPRFNVNAPLTGWTTGEITISGTIDDISYMKIDLTDCEIISAAVPETTTAAATAAATITATTKNSRTVYVSSSGKYHAAPDCSGMKNYTEMSLDDAIAAGYEPCDKCF